MASVQDSGSRWLTPFAHFDLDSSSSRTSPGSQPRLVPVQASLLSEPSSLIWPKQVTWDRQFVYELPTSERLTTGSGSSSSPDVMMLPTPRVTSERNGRRAMVENQQWSSVSLAQAIEIARGELPREFDSWDEVPGALGRSAREKLLPTPDAGNFNDGQTVETYLARKEREMAKGYNGNGGGTPLAMFVRLLPTPVVTDSYGSRRSTARTDEWTSNPGTSLTDAIWETQGRETDTKGNLLPTPTAREGNGESEDPDVREGGPALRDAIRLLPTPGANDSTGGEGPTRAARQEAGDTGGPSLRDIGHLLPTPDTVNRKSTKAMTASTENGRRSGGGNSSPPALEQIAELQAGRWPRDMPPYEELPPATREIVDGLLPMFPTPAARDGENASEQQFRHYAGQGDNPTLLGASRRVTGTLKHSESSSGASTPPPSSDGNGFSDAVHPHQLTIEDA